MIANPCFHCWRHAQTLVNPAEIVMHKLAATGSLVSNWCPVFALNASRSMFLCAYLCITELPSLDYTREIDVFEPASSPSEAATFEHLSTAAVSRVIDLIPIAAFFLKKILQQRCTLYL